VFKRRGLLKQLASIASSYEQWRDVAVQLASLDASEQAKKGVAPRVAFDPFDAKLLQDKIAHLRRVRATGNVKEVMLGIRTDLIRNIANIAKW
jgi:TAG lipase/steryl ester hydrolase/phospholipase A2/LPA acyltransferase